MLPTDTDTCVTLPGHAPHGRWELLSRIIQEATVITLTRPLLVWADGTARLQTEELAEAIISRVVKEPRSRHSKVPRTEANRPYAALPTAAPDPWLLSGNDTPR
jgi:hypothetical protein